MKLNNKNDSMFKYYVEGIETEKNTNYKINYLRDK